MIDTDIAETVEGEPGNENLLLLALEGIEVGRFRGAQVGGIERAVGIQHLRVADGHGLAALALEFQADGADHVLAEIEDILIVVPGVFRLRFAHRLQLHDCAHGRAGADAHFGRRLFVPQHRRPGALVVFPLGPGTELEPGIVLLADKEIGAQDWAGRRLPRRIGGDGLDAAVGEANFQLREKHGALDVELAIECVAGEAAGPAVAEQNTERIRAGTQQRLHVVNAILDRLAVIGPAGRKIVVAYALAIDVGFKNPQRGDVKPGADDLARLDLKAAAKRRHGRGEFRSAHDGGFDPFRLPIRIGQRGLEPGDFAPGRRGALVIPNLDAPEVAGARSERLAGVGDVGRGVRFDAAGIPGVGSFAVGEQIGLGGNLDLVGGLAQPAARGWQLPAQAGLLDVQPERLVEIFGAEVGGIHGGEE